MSEQASLFEFAPASDDKTRERNPAEHIFFAVKPDLPALDQALSLGESLRQSQQLSEPLRPGRLLHVTLRSLPGYPKSTTKDAYVKAALAAVSGLQCPEIRLTFDRAEPFGGGAYVLTGDNPKIVDLVKALGILLHRAGIPSQQHTPHMTLLYTKANPLACEMQPLIWTATEVVLIRSYPGESRHERRGSVRLTKSA